MKRGITRDYTTRLSLRILQGVALQLQGDCPPSLLMLQGRSLTILVRRAGHGLRAAHTEGALLQQVLERGADIAARRLQLVRRALRAEARPREELLRGLRTAETGVLKLRGAGGSGSRSGARQCELSLTV